MHLLFQFKILLSKYKYVFQDFLNGWILKEIKKNILIFQDTFGQQMLITIKENYVFLAIKRNLVSHKIEIELPKREQPILVKEVKIEKRPTGSILEKIEKTYGCSKIGYGKTLLKLNSERYVFPFAAAKYALDETLYARSFMKTTFMCEEQNPSQQLYSTKTTVNQEDISYLYDMVDGSNQINRIYDLYNGNINKRNSEDLYAIHLGLLRKEAFGYREILGITNQEDRLVGTTITRTPNQMNASFIKEFLKNKIGYDKEMDVNDTAQLRTIIDSLPKISKTKNF